MMKRELFEEVLTLFLIEKIPEYKKSFNLIKVLERIFSIYNQHLLENLTKKDLLSRTLNNNVFYYTILPRGYDVLNQNEDELKVVLRMDYINEHEEYISGLLKR